MEREDYGTSNIDDIMYLYDLLNDLPTDLTYQFPELGDIKRRCEEMIEERCYCGE